MTVTILRTSVEHLFCQHRRVLALIRLHTSWDYNIPAILRSRCGKQCRGTRRLFRIRQVSQKSLGTSLCQLCPQLGFSIRQEPFEGSFYVFLSFWQAMQGGYIIRHITLYRATDRTKRALHVPYLTVLHINHQKPKANSTNMRVRYVERVLQEKVGNAVQKWRVGNSCATVASLSCGGRFFTQLVLAKHGLKFIMPAKMPDKTRVLTDC